MRERLQELNADVLAERGSTATHKCEQALAMATLASFLSYLCFSALPFPPSP